jgi:pimeloyl-ACP methyl ester carboxylesterase
MRAAWAYFAAFPQTAQDFAELAKTKLTIPVLAIAGEKASAATLSAQMKLVANDVAVLELKDTGHWVMEKRKPWMLFSSSFDQGLNSNPQRKKERSVLCGSKFG